MGKAVNRFAAMGIAALALSSLPHLSRETVEATVKDVKENVVVTDKGEFENTRSALEWKFSPYELEEGKKYVIGVYGWESVLFSDWRRNIMYVEEIRQ